MYKVEIIFNSKDLTQSDMDQICEETDQSFEREELSCADRQPGKIYILTVDENGFGRFWGGPSVCNEKIGLQSFTGMFLDNGNG